MAPTAHCPPGACHSIRHSSGIRPRPRAVHRSARTPPGQHLRPQPSAQIRPKSLPKLRTRVRFSSPAPQSPWSGPQRWCHGDLLCGSCHIRARCRATSRWSRVGSEHVGKVHVVERVDPERRPASSSRPAQTRLTSDLEIPRGRTPRAAARSSTLRRRRRARSAATTPANRAQPTRRRRSRMEGKKLPCGFSVHNDGLEGAGFVVAGRGSGRRLPSVHTGRWLSSRLPVAAEQDLGGRRPTRTRR